SCPTCKLEVSSGANPAVGTCAFANNEVVLILLMLAGFGLEKTSPPLSSVLLFHCIRSFSKAGAEEDLLEKSNSRNLGSISSKNLDGSQFIKVPNLNRDVA